MLRRTPPRTSPFVRGDRTRWSGPHGAASAAQGPLLVGAVEALPELDLGAVGGAERAGVQAEPGLHAGDGAVGVDVPLLVVLAVAVPDDRGGAVGRAASGGVQTLVAVDLQLLARGDRPPLVGAAVAVPQRDLRAVGGGVARHVDAPVGLVAHDLDALRRRPR